MKVAVYRKESFSAAHRLYNALWSDDTNDSVFGKCANPHYHGHNYDVIVKLVGEVDPETGYVMDMKILSDLMQEHIVSYFDHRNLNEDCKEFKTLNPTAENIVVVIFNLLRPHIPPQLDVTIRLYETKRNFVQYPV